MKILFIEPYYGGSHRSFADGYVRHSRHELRLITMPARKWKWRMRGGAVWLSDRMPRFDPDIILASDFLDLATFCALLPPGMSRLPRAVYFHENQLTYPFGSHAWRDYQFGLTNITSCLAADRVFFNSDYHRKSFLKAADVLLRKMPDCLLCHVPERISERSEIVPVGLETCDIDRVAGASGRTLKKGPLHIIWNHRWEFDKNPEEFFRAVKELDAQNVPFQLSVMGQAFRKVPDAFEKIEKELRHRLVHLGFVENKDRYFGKLLEGDVVVSTALHEFFGISVLEAIYAGCLPLLPRRLSYPELIPPALHRECLYDSHDDLTARLKTWANEPERVRRKDCRHVAERYDWKEVAAQLDDRLGRMV